MTEQLLYAKEAYRALEANLSPRYKRLDVLERYCEGTQYEGRASFWSDARPLFERAPCIVYPIVESAIRSNVDLCLGDTRWPAITSLAGEDDSLFDDRFGLDENDSETLDHFIECIEKQSRLKPKARELLHDAQAVGTAVAILGARSGRLFIDTTRAKWCTPQFDPVVVGKLVSLEIRYPYLEQYKDERENKWALRCMLYRRVIDDKRDVTYKPAKASEDGKEPTWTEDKDKTVEHGFSFCPVVWYKFLPTCSTVADIDGKAVHDCLLDEIDCLNFALSLRHRGALYASDPQPIEIGVAENHDPAPQGRMARVVVGTAKEREVDGYLGPSWIDPGAGQSHPARMRGPGVVWRYPDEKTKVELLTLPGDAMLPAKENADDLRAKIAEALAVVFTDPNNQPAATQVSGRALREYHKRQLERCDQIRDDFGTNCLLPIIDMLLRIVMVVGDGLYLSGVKETLPILQRFMSEVDGQESEQWFSPNLQLDWGEYFMLTGQDKLADIQAVAAAHDAGFITTRSAVEEMRDYFNIGNVDEYMEALDEESAEKQQKALENAQAMAATQPQQSDDPKDKQPPGGPQKPAKTPTAPPKPGAK